MCFGCMRKCISPRFPQQHKDGGKEGKKGGENKEKRKNKHVWKQETGEREGGGQTTNRKKGKENSLGRTGKGGGRKQKTQCLQITN